MALFSSTQPSLRVRVLPRFPAQVLAGNGMQITKSNGTYVFATTATQVDFASLINAPNDALAAAAGVSVGQPYRNGSVVMVRVT